jgi:hypothetical protein
MAKEPPTHRIMMSMSIMKERMTFSDFLEAMKVRNRNR